MDTIILLACEEEKAILADIQLPSDVKVMVTGIGAINIIRSLSSLSLDSHIINIGHAGSKNIEVGSWVEVSASFLHHPSIQYDEPELVLDPLPAWIREVRPSKTDMPKAVCYTSTDFVNASTYSDCLFDMELAFIVSWGFTKVSALKIVSDNLSHQEYVNFVNKQSLP